MSNEKKQHNILITGGKSLLAAQIISNLRKDEELSCICTRFDRKPPQDSAGGVYVQGTICDMESFRTVAEESNSKILIHLAGWQQYYYDIGAKHRKDFFDLNIQGTFSLLETLPKTGIKCIVYISNTATNIKSNVSGWSALMCENMLQHYASTYDVKLIILRMSPYIPHFDAEQFQGNFYEWAKQFWIEGIHVDDAASACVNCIKIFACEMRNDNIRLMKKSPPLILSVSSLFDNKHKSMAETKDFLNEWQEAIDNRSHAEFFSAVYGDEILEGLKRFQLEISRIPKLHDISRATKFLNGWKPKYSRLQVIYDLLKYGHKGMKGPAWAGNPNAGNFLNDDGVYIETA